MADTWQVFIHDKDTDRKIALAVYRAPDPATAIVRATTDYRALCARWTTRKVGLIAEPYNGPPPKRYGRKRSRNTTRSLIS